MSFVTGIDDETESIYGQLSASERIINVFSVLNQGQVSISLDWNDLPADLIESLENLDDKKYHSTRKNAKKFNVNELSPSKSLAFMRATAEQAKPYTFNNCHFHYEKKQAEAARNAGSRDNVNSDLLPDPRLHGIQLSPNKKNMGGTAMSVSEFDHPTERYDERVVEKNRSVLPSPRPNTASQFSQSIYSTISKRMDEVEMRKARLSKTKLDGVEREKQVIKTVHQELCELSRDLKNKSAKVKEEELALSQLKSSLNAQRVELERKEKNVNFDAQQLVTSALRKRETQIKVDTEKIVLKYEDALEQLSKENKRLQTSLKDMVTTSRTLREQNKKVQAEVDQKDAKIEELGLQLKQAKERAERLKVISTVTPSPQQESIAAQDLFAQMKKIANTQHLSAKKTVPAYTQTAEDISDTEKKFAQYEHQIAISSNLIKYLLCQNTTQGSLIFYEAINGSFDYIRKECADFAICLEEYMLLVFKGLPSIPPADQHALASHVYFALSELKHTSNTSTVTDKAMVLLHLIPLYTISQPEVVDALLDGLLSQLSNSVLSRSAMLEYGIDPIIEMLITTPIVESTAGLASAVLMTLITEDGFSRVFRNLGTLAIALGLDHSVKTIENLVVILQKLSKNVRLPREMMPLVTSLHERHLSDFCDLNLKSIILAAD